MVVRPKRDPHADFVDWVSVRGPGLLRLAYLLTGGAVEAEDLVEDVLSRALPRWSKIAAVEHPDASVRRLVVQEHTSWWRRFRRRATPVALPVGAEAAEAVGLPVEELDRLWRACCALPDGQRASIVLRLYEQLEYADIADLTGVRDATARSRVSRGLATLHAELAEEDVGDADARVRSALEGAAAGAPSAVHLIERARARASTRRRGRVTTVAGVALAAVTVTSVVVLSLREGTVDTVIPGVERTRAETWRDVTVQVPVDWGYGGLSSWCLTEGDTIPDPRVERPGGPERAFGCLDPARSYGVQFVDLTKTGTTVAGEPTRYDWAAEGSSHDYPDGAWVGSVEVGEVAVVAVTRDLATAERILSSAQQVTDRDPNGCRPRVDGTLDLAAAQADRISVCRYDADGWLQQSERLSEDDSRQAWAELGQGPPPAPNQPRCVSSPAQSATVVLGDRVSVSWSCPSQHEVRVAGERHQLTSRDLYWALSPGATGAFDPSVPLPERRREQPGSPPPG